MASLGTTASVSGTSVDAKSVQWTSEVERKVITLWSQVTAQQGGKMRTLKDKREWTKEKLVDWGRHVEVEGLDGIVKLTDKQLKNKTDSIKRKGRKNVEDFVLPCLKELRREARLKSPTSMPTGSAAPEEGIEQLDDDFRCLIDWPLLEAKAKWSNLRLYYELFGEHPTWGLERGPLCWKLALPLKTTAALVTMMTMMATHCLLGSSAARPTESNASLSQADTSRYSQRRLARTKNDRH